MVRLGSDGRLLFFFCLLVGPMVFMGLLAGCREAGVDASAATSAVKATPTQFTMHRYQNEQAFDLLYPASWSQNLVSEGLMVFSPPELMDFDEPGTSLVVFRRKPFTGPSNLEEVMTHYLDNGPLQSGYQVLTEIKTITLGGQAAFEVVVEKQAGEEAPAMRAYIITTRTKSGADYIFTATAPQAEWDEQWLLLQTIVQSVKFNE